jgi:hypothetical protein
MATRRVSIAALLCSVGGALASSPSAHADAPPASAPPVIAIPEPSTDGANDALVGQEVPSGVAADAYEDTDPGALTDFRETLDPHGTWVDDPTYGTVWAPSPDEIGEDFTPYVSAGHWVYDGDYVWVSDYAWGWVAFHYGRWQRISERGWVWMPGRLYAAAWVVWRVGIDGYGFIGWAPMPPTWAWRGGMAIGTAFAPQQSFVFCPHGDLFAPAIATHLVTGDSGAVLAPHTRPYVHANPVVAGHPLAQATMHGPPIASLGLDASEVVHITGAERGLARAQQYARPSTAQALGARQPVPHVVSPRPTMLLQHIARPATRTATRR